MKKRFFCFLAIILLFAMDINVFAHATEGDERISGVEITTNRYIAAEETVTGMATESGNGLAMSAADVDIYLQALEDAKNLGAISVLAVGYVSGPLASGGEKVGMSIPRAKGGTNLYVAQYTSGGRRLIKPTYIDWGYIEVKILENCTIMVFKIPADQSLSASTGGSSKAASTSTESTEPKYTSSPYTGKTYYVEFITLLLLVGAAVFTIRAKRHTRIPQVACVIICFVGLCVMAHQEYADRQDQLLYQAMLEEQMALAEVEAAEEVVEEPVVELTEQEKYEAMIPKRLMDWKQLRLVNEDIYAWIYIDGTNINYPILSSGKDKKNNYYINHTLDGTKGEKLGCIFSQKTVNSTDFTDFNQVLYGHNLEDGTMFSELLEYKDTSFLDQHKYMYVYTKEKTYIYEIFAAYKIDDQLLSEKYDFKSEEGIQKYIDEVLANTDEEAVINNDIELTTDSNIITMSTCIDDKKDCRFVVQGVRVY